jgi:hypothetical protein
MSHPIITDTFFVGYYAIPNLGNQTQSEVFNSFLFEYEKECLNKLFGYGMYKELIAALAITPPQNIPAKWVALRDGSEFTVDGKMYKQNGIKPIIRNYIWFKYLEANSQQLTTVGLVASSSENANLVSPIQKMGKVYEYMLEEVNLIYAFVESIPLDYPLFVREDIESDFLYFRNSFDI